LVDILAASDKALRAADILPLAIAHFEVPFKKSEILKAERKLLLNLEGMTQSGLLKVENMNGRSESRFSINVR
jgi:hypothetical protein